MGSLKYDVNHLCLTGRCLPLRCPLRPQPRRRPPAPPPQTSGCPGLCEETTHSFPASSTSLPWSQQTKTPPTTKEVSAEAKVDSLLLCVLDRHQQDPPADQETRRNRNIRRQKA